jgi:hypothetical protein
MIPHNALALPPIAHKRVPQHEQSPPVVEEAKDFRNSAMELLKRAPNTSLLEEEWNSDAKPKHKPVWLGSLKSASSRRIVHIPSEPPSESRTVEESDADADADVERTVKTTSRKKRRSLENEQQPQETLDVDGDNIPKKKYGSLLDTWAPKSYEQTFNEAFEEEEIGPTPQKSLNIRKVNNGTSQNNRYVTKVTVPADCERKKEWLRERKNTLLGNKERPSLPNFRTPPSSSGGDSEQPIEIESSDERDEGIPRAKRLLLSQEKPSSLETTKIPRKPKRIKPIEEEEVPFFSGKAQRSNGQGLDRDSPSVSFTPKDLVPSFTIESSSTSDGAGNKQVDSVAMRSVAESLESVAEAFEERCSVSPPQSKRKKVVLGDASDDIPPLARTSTRLKITKQNNNTDTNAQRRKKQAKKITPGAAIQTAKPMKRDSDGRREAFEPFEDRSYRNGTTMGKLYCIVAYIVSLI